MAQRGDLGFGRPDRRQSGNLLSALAAVLLAGGLLIPLGGTLLVLGAVNSSLRPLGSLADEVRTLGPDSLERRFNAESAPIELVPIHLRLNELLARLQAAFERERRFTSDVSHELRTPLAEARTAVEMAARWPGDQTLHEAACQDALGAIDQMQGLVSTLLFLARAETGTVSLQTQPLDLGELTVELIERLAPHTVLTAAPA